MTDRFNLPIDISRLENDRIKLVPLEDNLHEWAALWVADANAHPTNYEWLTYGPFADTAAFLSWYEATMRPSTSEIMFAILLKAGSVTRKDIIPPAPTTATATTNDDNPPPPATTTTTFNIPNNTFAGIAGLGGAPDRATADLGQLLLTQFQRTFVGTHANALLLHHLLDPPTATPGTEGTAVDDSSTRSKPGRDLGLRRVQWQCNAANTASVRAAQRLGFRMEGVIRWHQVLPVGKTGDGTVEAGAGEWGPGRHTAMLSLCWDDWVGGGRERIDALVRR